VVGQMGQYWGVYTSATTVWTRDNEPQGSSTAFPLSLAPSFVHSSHPSTSGGGADGAVMGRVHRRYYSVDQGQRGTGQQQYFLLSLISPPFVLPPPHPNSHMTAGGGADGAVLGRMSLCHHRVNSHSLMFISHAHIHAHSCCHSPHAHASQVVGQMGQYWGVYTGATTVWTRDNEVQGSNNAFTLLLLGAQLTRDIPMNNSLRVMIQAPNGQLLQAHEDGTLTADYSSNATNETLWSGPAVFFMDLVSTVHGDWQAAYTAGPDQASTLFDSVHSKLITELDWQDMKARGVNTVCIPIPYWIAQEDPSFAFSSPAHTGSNSSGNSSSSNDSSSTPTATPGTPEFPYPPGSLAYLDWAFEMAAKYGLRVWLSVHVAPGSQIGAAFSRDGLIRWSGLNVDHTLDFVRWIGDRFGGNPSLFGVGLLHEPVAPSYYGVLGVDGDELREYYRKAHDLIRERCACCFVSIEGRVGKSMWDVAFHMLDTWHPNVLYETHLYNMLAGIPMATRKLPQLVELEIGEERSNRPTLLDSAQSIGRPILVGEFGVAMASLGATEEQQNQFTLAQIQALGHATHAPVHLFIIGRPILVGEFGVAMASKGATEEQQKQFTLAQMQALGHAQAGWFFWSWKLNVTGNAKWQFPLSMAMGWLPKKDDGNWY
ncbi:unnamed protein product, partial [Closterium sp. NIES-54]